MISVIIPYKDDGNIIMDCVSRLIENQTDIEVIVVDDGSIVPLPDYFSTSPMVKIIRSHKNHGVGAAFDMGVKYATGDILFLMGCDVMVKDRLWASRVKELAEAYPKSIISTGCVAVSPDDGYALDESKKRAGADLLFKVPFERVTEPKRSKGYLDILIGVWLPVTPQNITKTPCLMGAAYVVTKEWYNHIHGFEGHRVWGGLEPYISIKSWFAGGDVMADPNFITGHVFGRNAETRRSWRGDLYYYNKMLIAKTCFSNEMSDEMIKYLGNALNVGQARAMIRRDSKLIEKIREYNQSIFVRGAEVFEQEFGYNIDL